MTQIPVFQTVFGVYLYLWQERQNLWQLTLPPIVILSILGALVQWGTASSIVTSDSTAYMGIHRPSWAVVLSQVGVFISIWIWVSYSVAWHRGYLLEGQDNNLLNTYRWSKRQLRFIWTAIKIFFLMIPALFIIPVFVAPATLGIVFVILVITTYGYVYARLLIWFPAVAVDQDLDIRSLWKLSEKNGWRLLCIIVCVSVPLICLSFLAYLITGPQGFFAQSHSSLTISLLSNLLFKLLSFMELAASISALSIAYKFFLDCKTSHLEPD